MARGILQHLEAIEELLDSQKHQEALEQLKSIKSQSMDDSQRARFCISWAWANISINNCDVVKEIELAQDYYKKANDCVGIGKVLFHRGRMFAERGDHRKALRELLLSCQYFEKSNLPYWQGVVLNNLARVSWNMCDIFGAANYILKAIYYLEIVNDDEGVSVLRTNLGAIYMVAGQLERARREFDACGDPLTKKNNKAVYYCDYALCCARKGDITKAKILMDKVTFREIDRERLRATCYQDSARVHVLAGELQQAEEELLIAVKIASAIAPESSLYSEMAGILAEVYVKTNRYDLAMSYAQKAFSVAKKVNALDDIAVCYRVFAQVDKESGKYEEAREWFRKSIGLFARIQYNYELATTRLMAAKSGLFEEGDKAALIFLARDYFAQEEIKPLLEECDSLAIISRSAPKITKQATVRDTEGETLKIVAVNPRMKQLLEVARNVAPSEMSVLLTGPTGVGKDILARYIHDNSQRSGRFVSVNAAGIPDTMIESELFGYRRGAFTGADTDKCGLFEEAEGGTFYLNEIADATLSLQAKLLDVLENNVIRRLGETKERKVSFRLIAATNHDIGERIAEGKFRADLYYRLNEMLIVIPPLSERYDDIPELFSYFLRQYGVDVSGRQNQEAFTKLVDYFSTCNWPGNVRQFEAEVKRMAYLHKNNLTLMANSISDQDALKRRQLHELLRKTGWNRREAARQLGMHESTIRKQIKKWHLVPD